MALSFFWGFWIAQADHIFKFEDNFENLKKALGDLEAERDDVLNRIYAEELKGRQRLTVVSRWLRIVETIETDTNLLLDDASAVQQRLSTYGYCSNTIISVYACGIKIHKKLSEVQSVLSAGAIGVVSAPAPAPAVIVKVGPPIVGLDKTLETTWKILMDDKNKILGIYGMGGVGKTTLLNLINNKFDEVKNEFDVVIWITVSKDADVGKIQDDIGKRLGLYDKDWCTKSKVEKARDIHMVLSYKRKRFVLLLDDLWKKVSLTEIGIPLLGRNYKVVFTTRFKNVCRRMETNDDIEVPRLAEKDAWYLFKKQAGYEGTNGRIFDIAKKVAAKCCGLPLALQVIGQTLASKATEDEWLTALDTLESFPSEMKGTEKGIFQVLKLSYDNLEEKDAKLCFQYCALFPKTYNIKRDDLVEYWIGEGIIGARCRRQIAKYRGDQIIDNLVNAFLLLKDGEYVYMHDMIREMAFWIVSELLDGERFVVKTDAGLSQLPYVTDWTTVTKMSLMNNEIKSIPDHPEFPSQARLKTLFLQNNRLVDIIGKFFVVMSTLVVLDLSRNPGLTKLPEEISMLVALRYLNLSRTRIKHLPEGLGELTQLIHLDLEATYELQRISLVSCLLNLQVLRFYGSKASIDLSLLEKLERLEDLELLTTTVREFYVLTAFLGSKLAETTQSLYLQGLKVSGISFASTFGALGSLCTLEMVECDIMESDTEWEEKTRHQFPTPSNQITPSNTWFKNLSAVVLLSCEGLRDLTWLIYATNLESLSITLSPMMEELISKEKVEGVVVEPFLKLEVLRLYYLDELKSIHWSSLCFPSLRKVDIKNCPKLRKLPLNSTSVKSIDDLRIQVDDGWLEGVVWEDEASKERFCPLIRTTSTV